MCDIKLKCPSKNCLMLGNPNCIKLIIEDLRNNPFKTLCKICRNSNKFLQNLMINDNPRNCLYMDNANGEQICNAIFINHTVFFDLIDRDAFRGRPDFGEILCFGLDFVKHDFSIHKVEFLLNENIWRLLAISDPKTPYGSLIVAVAKAIKRIDYKSEDERFILINETFTTLWEQVIFDKEFYIVLRLFMLPHICSKKKDEFFLANPEIERRD